MYFVSNNLKEVGQSAAIMDNIVKQILIGTTLGDGHITSSGIFSTGCKYKEWVDYKMSVLKEYRPKYNYLETNGFSPNPYHRFTLHAHEDIKLIWRMNLKELCNSLDELGLAVWFYDDGSLHKRNLFYNLNTHSYTQEEHDKYIIPCLNSFGIKAKTLTERKPDGRIFTYTWIPKTLGAQIVNRVLKQLPIKCYKYKTYEGNINDTITYKPIKLTHILTNTVTIFDTATDAGKSIKLGYNSVKKYAKNGKEYKGYKIEFYRYE
jgi:hypothetical protein